MKWWGFNFCCYQPILINLRINNMTLHFTIVCNTYTKVQSCMHMIHRSFPLISGESRCIQIPRSFFYGRGPQPPGRRWEFYLLKNVRMAERKMIGKTNSTNEIEAEVGSGNLNVWREYFRQIRTDASWEAFIARWVNLPCIFMKKINISNV